jgi:transcription termination factor NusB
MWDKKFRYIIFSLAYQFLFWSEHFDFDNTFETLTTNTYKPEDEVNLKKIAQKSKDTLDIFKTNQQDFEIILRKYLASYDKTYPLIKAILFTALLEDFLIDKSQSRKPLMSKYIHLTQEMVGGKNPTVVNAVLGNVFGVERNVIAKDPEK